ncbi:sorting nexin Mvp1 [Schizosaccharomyces cryophilus OY26]|uniref:Sorting nexin MVP1 n=1 Tax=Schizosaccharomyces cryophilus (strain OY26 / ATCC MYA-4695 / CBS 11777 / NBRC 106824 / NRRL Y48691) TaxID=653667 RepID=S9XGC7_SCHCR|nr:sorting nexin Mvp1 [Schizosaccharomyces cryophilus OY26]EPY52726.1 sorting nexin Mvp1 [Schizosaccharomyces cryophilus OY26]
MSDNVFMEPDPWASNSTWGSPIKPLTFETALGNSSIPSQYKECWEEIQNLDQFLYPNPSLYSKIFGIPDQVISEFFDLIQCTSEPLQQRQFFALLALAAFYQLGVPTTLEQLQKQRNVLPILQRCNLDPSLLHNETEAPLFSHPSTISSRRTSSNPFLVSSIPQLQNISPFPNFPSTPSPTERKGFLYNYDNPYRPSSSFSSESAPVVPDTSPSPREGAAENTSYPPRKTTHDNFGKTNSPIYLSQPFTEPSLDSLPQSLIDSSKNNQRNFSRRYTHTDPFFNKNELNVDIDLEPSGSLFYRHNNYIISDSRNTREVLRRYSDFYWLHSYLVEKYPWRRVPLLPSKKFHFAKRTASSRNTFLEHRRQGLYDFVNDVAYHPIFSEDEIVQVFFKEPNVFKNWRKENSTLIKGSIASILQEPMDSVPDVSESCKERLLKAGTACTIAINNQVNIIKIFEKAICTVDHLHDDINRLQNSFNCLLDSGIYHRVFNSTFAQRESNTMSLVSRHAYNIDTLLHQRSFTLKNSFIINLTRETKMLISLRQLIERMTIPFGSDLTKVKHLISNDENLLREATINDSTNGRSSAILDRSPENRIENSLHKKKQFYADTLRQRFRIDQSLQEEIQYLQNYITILGNPYIDYCKQHIKYEEEGLNIWQSLKRDFEILYE